MIMFVASCKDKSIYNALVNLKCFKIIKRGHQNDLLYDKSC